MKASGSFAYRLVVRLRRPILRSLAFVFAGAPALVLAQYSEIKMGEYLHYAVAAANGGVYAGIDGIGYTGIGFGVPSVYRPDTGWVDLPSAMGFDTTKPYYGQPKGISHDGSVVAGYMDGVATNGISTQYAAYWLNGAESLVPAPPDDPTPTLMNATGVSGDGTTLIVQDQTSNKTESYVFKIASGTFASLGFLGGSNQQTYATAINHNGAIVAGYYNLDNGDIHGFVWNASSGLTDMGLPPGHPDTFYLEPTCISDDGTTVFGQLTEGNGWAGFRYNATTGFQDLGGIAPSACAADGMEAVGIASLYFPAIWSMGNGSGFLDHLLSANGTAQALGTLDGPVTVSPDGSAVTAIGPDVYLTDQIWYGTWQISLPSPLKTAAFPPAKLTFSTPYQETLTEPAGTLIQSAEFAVGVSAALVTKPNYASAFALKADGSFTYTPKPGYISDGSDPENGAPNDRFTYQLTGPNGTSANAVVEIVVTAPAAPTVDTPTATNVAATTATLGGNVSSDGGAAITGIGVVYAPTAVNSNPQLGGAGVAAAAGSGATGAFTIDVSGLTPGTDYSFAAYATNSVGAGYSATGVFTTASAGPDVTTLAASSISGLSATLHASVNPNGDETMAYIEYGLDISYGNFTPTNLFPAGNAAQPVAELITGLTLNQTYHFRAVGWNGFGTNLGADLTFSTLAVAPLIQCPGDIIVNSAHGQCQQVAPFSVTVTAGSPAPAIAFELNGSPITSPYAFPVGQSIVSVTATNIAGTNTCNFSVAVVDAELPVAGPNQIGASQGSPVTVDVAKVLLSCANPSGLPLAITAVASPTASGAIVTLAGGKITYAPAATYVGPDILSYTLWRPDKLIRVWPVKLIQAGSALRRRSAFR